MKEKVILTENISVKEEKAYSEWKNKSRTYLFFVKKRKLLQFPSWVEFYNKDKVSSQGTIQKLAEKTLVTVFNMHICWSSDFTRYHWSNFERLLMLVTFGWQNKSQNFGFFCREKKPYHSIERDNWPHLHKVTRRYYGTDFRLNAKKKYATTSTSYVNLTTYVGCHWIKAKVLTKQ